MSVIEMVPPCVAVKVADALLATTGTVWLKRPLPKVPWVDVKVTVVAPGADATIVCGALVTMAVLLAGEVIDNDDAAKATE